MRPLLPFATLLGAAFLLGCQDPGPVGPEGLGILLDKEGITHTHGGGGGGNKGGGGKKDLIEEGRILFFDVDFGGNGRTCGTCHRDLNNLTIDVAFIATLPNTDPLFVAEDTNFDLMDLEDGGEFGLLRTRGLILENIEGGFDGVPFFRAPPSLFNLSATAPYGLNGDIPDLRQFSTGAVIQHFPKTLARCAAPCEGGAADFRLPTEPELDALEAFMLSLQSQGGNFKVSGPRSLLSTAADRKAQNTSRPEVAGRDLFVSVGCASCHVRNKAFSGGNFNTGVEAFDKASGSPTPTTDLGFGGTFQTPGLFGLRKAAFFHNNAVVGLQAAVEFYVSPEFQASPSRGRVDPNMSPADIQKIVAFLEAIKCPLGTVPPDCDSA